MKKVLSTSFILFCGILYAQQENTTTDPMVTDRPGATESPLTVPKGSLQIETGGFYTSFEEEGLKSETYGYNTTLLRYGILDNFKPLRMEF